RPAGHRHLHSFPTRRSSDLHCDLDMTRLAAGVTRQAEQDAGPGGRLREEAVEKTFAALARFAEKAAELGAAAPVGGATAAVRDADRKSTRLNSSHVKISYAV